MSTMSRPMAMAWAAARYVSVYMAGEGGGVEGAIALGRFFKDNSPFTRIVRDARYCTEEPCALAPWAAARNGAG